MLDKSHELYTDADGRMRKVFSAKRSAGTLSKAHEESHVSAVSTFGAATSGALLRGQGFDSDAERSELLTGVAGIFHDIEREATETAPHGPAGAEWFRRLIQEDVPPWNSLTAKEADRIYTTIKEHEGSFGDIRTALGSPIAVDRSTDITTPDEALLTSIMAHAIVTGDKALEASGPRVVERRSVFVGGERLKNGDLARAGFKYPDDAPLVVLGETMIRLYGRNPIDGYPFWLKEFAQSWHGTQYELYRGLLAHLGLSEEHAARVMLERKFPKFTEDLAGTIKRRPHLSGDVFGDLPLLRDLIRDLDDLDGDELGSLAAGAARIVNEFAQAGSPREAMDAYRPGELTTPYDVFMRGIIDYNMGDPELVDRLSRSIETSVRRYAVDIATRFDATI